MPTQPYLVDEETYPHVYDDDYDEVMNQHKNRPITTYPRLDKLMKKMNVILYIFGVIGAIMVILILIDAIYHIQHLEL